VKVWRVVKRKHAAKSFDGKAAQRFGGRFNSPGRRVVYTSATKSLALLEVLVHIDVGRPLPRLVAFSFQVPDDLIETLAGSKLPRQWRSSEGMPATQRIGDEWLESGRSLALAVPSASVPEEYNYLLNPEHAGFARLKFGRALPFLVDPRLST